MKIIFALSIAFLFSGCTTFFELLSYPVKVENLDVIYADSSVVYYSNTFPSGTGFFKGAMLDQAHDFKKLKSNKSSVVGKSSIVYKVEHIDGVTDYFFDPRSNNTLRYITGGVAIGLVTAGVLSFRSGSKEGSNSDDSFRKKSSGFFMASLGGTFLVDFIAQRGINLFKLNLKKKREFMPKRIRAQKYIRLNNISVKNAEVKYEGFQNLKKYQEKKPCYSHFKKERMKKIESNWNVAYISSKMNQIFDYYGFLPDKTVLRDLANDLLIDVKVNKTTYNLFIREDDIFKAYYDLEFTLTDGYGAKILSSSQTITNTPFFGQTPLSITESLNFAIQEAILDFINEEEVQYEINTFKTEHSDIIRNTIRMEDVHFARNLDEAIDATFTVKTESGHGSGWLLSREGYLVTNYHVIADRKEVQITNDVIDTLLDAEVINVNPKYDLALLKVNYDFPMKPFQVNQDIVMRGEKVFSIGTPAHISLGQSISKGVIAGYIKNEDNDYYQLDMKINPGNSGGPLVTDDGILIGIINAKIVGEGVEGIGFAIFSNQLEEALDVIID